jgi:hypothetical protein
MVNPETLATLDTQNTYLVVKVATTYQLFFSIIKISFAGHIFVIKSVVNVTCWRYDLRPDEKFHIMSIYLK